ncbi:MAG: family oxidoreductase [Caulobacteraceae bacterium]|nr:family oxidoreductase [Caulobacteraceae bacterium]
MARRLALITGASAGIGAALARVYAAGGYDIALTARRADRLEALANEIRLRFGVEVISLPANLADPGGPDAILAGLAENGRTCDALVNNAGYSLGGGYAETDWNAQDTFLRVLLHAPCEMTHKVLPGMIERRFGRIVNVASVAGQVPGLPVQTLYGATKGFLIKFSQALHQEVSDTGVHVTALCPGYTYSEFHDVNGTRAQMSRALPPWMWMGADEVAAAGYEAAEANRAVCTPGAPNKAIVAIAKLVPDDWFLALANRPMSRLRRG